MELVHRTQETEETLILENSTQTKRKADIQIVNPTHMYDWNLMVQKMPGSSLFFTSNWAAVLQKTYGFEPQYFILGAPESPEALVPLMEVRSRFTGVRGIGLPFSDYCTPLNRTASPIPADLFHRISEFARERGWKFVEMRGEGLPSETGQIQSSFYRHKLSLAEDDNIIFSKLRRNFRSKIRKAVKGGVAVSIFHSHTAMNEYYRLHCLTRKKHGLPPQPHSFFRNIYEHIISKELGFVALAKYKNQFIAGSVCFHFGDTVIYKLGASDPASLHIPANYLVMWETIQWACKQRYQTFCFGKTETANTGLIQFKDGWASEKETLNYYRQYLDPAQKHQRQAGAAATGYTVFRKMPLSMLKIAGALMYKHVA